MNKRSEDAFLQAQPPSEINIHKFQREDSLLSISDTYLHCRNLWIFYFKSRLTLYEVLFAISYTKQKNTPIVQTLMARKPKRSQRAYKESLMFVLSGNFQFETGLLSHLVYESLEE